MKNLIKISLALALSTFLMADANVPLDKQAMKAKLSKIAGEKSKFNPREHFPKEYFLIPRNLPYAMGLVLHHPESSTLGLSKEQIDKLLALKKEKKPKVLKMAKEVKDLELSLVSLVVKKSGTFTDVSKEMNALVDTIAKKKAEITKHHLKCIIDVQNTLTKEQREKVGAYVTNPKKAKMDRNGIVTKESFVDVKTTIDRLEKIIKAKGITNFNRINHAENSRNTGEKNVSDAELLIFGKPAVGLKMMGSDPKAGLDLPLKILAYVGKDSKVYISYRDTAFFPRIYKLEGTNVHQKMSGILGKLSSVITKSPEDFKLFMEKSKAKAEK